MRMSDLVDRARAASNATGVSSPALGLERLWGGMSHAVFAPVDDPTLVVKVFTTVAREEPEREWEALVTLAGSGVAPEPVHFDAGDSAVVVMTRVVGSSLPAGDLGDEHAAVIGSVHRRVHRRPEHSAPCLALVGSGRVRVAA